MRIGQNPAKFVDTVKQPQKITVALVTYIPFIGGYYSQSLDVLKVCLESLWANTDLPYDLLVFDNASCPEAREYLARAQVARKIQYLLLSDQNIGKGGAWNVIFGGAPGEILAYADSDIYFYPGWLSALVHVLEDFPQAGMVTGMPLWSPEEFSTSTVEWANKQDGASLERGKILAWEDYWRHSRSLGKAESEAHQHYLAQQDICLHYQNQRYFVGAGHFQFVARRQALQSVLPIPSERPMGQVRSLDEALNRQGYLRLSTEQWWVQHVGNILEGWQAIPGAAILQPTPKRKENQTSPKLLRRLMVWLHNKTFRYLYQ